MEGYSLLSHRSPPADVRRIPQRLVLFLACTVAYTRFPGVQMGLLCTCNTGITVISHQRRQGVQHASFFLRQGFVITCTLFAKPARQFIQAVQHRTMRSGSPSRPFSTTTQDMPAGLPKTWISLFPFRVLELRLRLFNFGFRISTLELQFFSVCEFPFQIFNLSDIRFHNCWL